MDLAVPVLRAVRAGEYEAVRRALVVVGRVGMDLGARAADPDAVLLGLLGEELRRRATCDLGLEARAAEAEPGRERLGQEHELSAAGHGAGDLRGEALEVGVAVVPHDVVLHSGNSQIAHDMTSPSLANRSTAASITSSRLQ